MKKIITLFVATCFAAIAFCQNSNYVIRGNVVDAVSKQPMQGASVFAQNTTLGTASDKDGNFTLWLPNGGYDLIITFTGYDNTVKRISANDAENKGLLIELKQKEKSLEDVVIKSSNEVKDGWERYGNFFLENFIGKTNNSKYCTIINKEVLQFYFYKKSNRLKVLASAPLEIENMALGYKIKYTLDSFKYEYNTQSAIYTGYPLFEALTAIDTNQQIGWQAKRQKAYLGSILHFMRSIYHQSLKEEGFEIQFVAKNKTTDTETAIALTNFYSALNYQKDDSTAIVDIVPNQPDIAVIYKKELPDPAYEVLNGEKLKDYQLSVITILPETPISIEQNGYYYNQDDITITGYWIWDKIADMVPYDYVPH